MRFMQTTARRLACSLALALFVACSTEVANRRPIGELFPSVRGEGLDGRAWELPRDLAGRPAILLIGYAQDAQFDADRWLFGLLQAQTPAQLLELPTIPGLIPSLAGDWIDKGMRSGIPSEDWSSVVTVYGGRAAEIATFTGNDRPRNMRVLLLDGEGRVRWFHDRGFSAREMLDLDHTARTLVEGG